MVVDELPGSSVGSLGSGPIGLVKASPRREKVIGGGGPAPAETRVKRMLYAPAFRAMLPVTASAVPAVSVKTTFPSASVIVIRTAARSDGPAGVGRQYEMEELLLLQRQSTGRGLLSFGKGAVGKILRRDAVRIEIDADEVIADVAGAGRVGRQDLDIIERLWRALSIWMV